ncbi:flavodoxin family protein [uncultured Methanobrevibacter sp.]|uniref:flavodoxin family protein n=1 Tax=uncultured Methanobrevibacter sp. TaxID=253161 RepID=UPI0025F57CE7|nr:flavodoxin family protein [uncultured Methanobrevibacter sp.]
MVEGAQSNGANVEYIDLYTYDFKGCMSCFACHLKKNSENPLCFWRDDLKEVLQMCLDSDVIVIGTPIYYGSISSSAQAFLERLLFAADTYVLDEDGNRVSKIKKEIKTAMIYTMNVTKEMDYFNGEDQLAIMRGYLTAIFGECEALYAYDTKQFKKYDPYLNNMFDPELKEKSKEVQFPKDCAKAFDLGKRLSDE